VLFNETPATEESEFFSMWAHHLTKKGVAKDAEKEISLDPRVLLPNLDHWYRYEGSLTSAPYSEFVSWIVLVDQLAVDSTEFQKLKKNAHQPDHRVQPINRRFVIRNFR
jgi:carbonic anhydrase